MPTMSQQCSGATDSAADLADAASPCSLPPVVQHFHSGRANHAAAGHHRRMSLEMPTSAAPACSINPNSGGTKAKSHGHMCGTAASNRAAASHAALRRRH